MLSPHSALLENVSKKIVHDKAEGFLVVPKWPTQPWFPLMLSLLVCDPILLPKSRSLLTQSTTGEPHPLINTASFDLLFCRLSGNQLRIREYQSQLQKLSWHRGEVLRSSSILPTSTSGCSFVLQDKLILCKRM